MLLKKQSMGAVSGQSRLAETKGLTLIEILVYFAVLALLTALAVPAFTGSYKRYQEDALVQNLEKNMRFAQYRAIMEGKAYALQYDASEHSYCFLREERQSESSRNIDWLPVEELWGKTRKISAQYSISCRGNDKIYFLPDGSVSEASLAVQAGSETLATLFMGRTLLGIDVKRKGALSHAA